MRETKCHPLCYVSVELAGQCIAFQPFLPPGKHSVIIKIVCREIVVDLIRATAHTHIMLHREAVIFVYGTEPVCVGPSPSVIRDILPVAIAIDVIHCVKGIEYTF